MKTREPGYERDAFEAARSGRFLRFDDWYHWYFVCTDCGEDTARLHIHQCRNREGRHA